MFPSAQELTVRPRSLFSSTESIAELDSLNNGSTLIGIQSVEGESCQAIPPERFHSVKRRFLNQRHVPSSVLADHFPCDGDLVAALHFGYINAAYQLRDCWLILTILFLQEFLLQARHFSALFVIWRFGGRLCLQHFDP